MADTVYAEVTKSIKYSMDTELATIYWEVVVKNKEDGIILETSFETDDKTTDEDVYAKLKPIMSSGVKHEEQMKKLTVYSKLTYDPKTDKIIEVV